MSRSYGGGPIDFILILGGVSLLLLLPYVRWFVVAVLGSAIVIEMLEWALQTSTEIIRADVARLRRKPRLVISEKFDG
jgi:hypothetical protein